MDTSASQDPKNKNYSKDVSLISTTDRSSIVTYANQTFCEIAEYHESELTGQPHNIVRHQDMPKAAFGQLWQYIQSGKSWMGLVKNQCKGGGHYWVSAFVTPISNEKGEIEEYQSVRSKPDSQQIDRAAKLYGKINRGERVSTRRLSFSNINIFLALLLLLQLALSTVGVFQAYSSVIGIVLTLLLLTSTLYSRKRAITVSELAKKSYDNPLMEKPYTGYFDEYSQIELALIMKKAELRAVSARTSEVTEKIWASAEESFNTSQSIEQSLEQQFHETDQLATATEELSHSIREVADSASKAATVTNDANSAALKGRDSLSMTIDVIEQLGLELNSAKKVIDHLSQDSKKIESILEVISLISEQTNLLALNAAIEAARAGEAGRGFAVVADEVRSLATKTRSSADEIQVMIHQLQQTAEQAVVSMGRGADLSLECSDRAHQTGELLNNISTMLDLVTDNSHQIAASVEQQASVTHEITKNTINIKTLAENTLTTSGSSVERTRYIVDDLDGLKRLLKQF